MTRPVEEGFAIDPAGHARRVLGFAEVLDHVARRAHTPGGRDRVLGLCPSRDPQTVGLEHERMVEMRRALDQGLAPWPLEGIHPIRELLKRAEHSGACLEGLELRQIARTLDVSRRLRRHGKTENPEAFPNVQRILSALGFHESLVAAVHEVVDERGELSDRASPLLVRLRRALLRKRESLLGRLEKLLRSEGASSDAYVTVRRDRYVIPMRTGTESSVRGIVHDRSSSGATVFVEPLEVLEANNEIEKLRSDEKAEVHRILVDLTQRVGHEATTARTTLDAMEELDALQARALWCRDLDAASLRSGPALRLQEARHPLLDLKLRTTGHRAVPLDVDMRQARVLVLTGPNTGGKTVALGTVGLLVLMHQSGLQVPAHPDSELPVFDRIVADIGDEQSISTSESTFSAHLRHVLGVVRDPESRTLALLDEFMAGTDPEEGAALAKVVLRRLGRGNGATLVTTHLGALKPFAHAEPGLENAGMEFDPQTCRPLYRLRPGIPGSSNAFAVAAHLGFDPELLRSAEQERGREAGTLQKLLQELETERAQIAETSREAAAATTEAKRMREDLATLFSQLSKDKRSILEDARKDAAEIFSEARARIEAVVRRLREGQAEKDRVREAHEAIGALEKSIESIVTPPETPEPVAALELHPGMSVRVRSLGRTGHVERLSGAERARVRLGNVTVDVPVADLEPTDEPRAKPRPAPGPIPDRPESSAGPGATGRLDLRGLEREPALGAVDQFLDRLVLEGLHRAEIIHGKGTGVLRQAVQEHLAHHPGVASYRLGNANEGGTGVTIAELL